MTKKVLYVGAFRFPNGDAAAQRVLNNAKIFKDLGYIVEFISWGGEPREIDKSDDGFYYYQDFKYCNTFEIDIKGLSPFKRIYNYFKRGKNSLKILSELIPETDIIIAYNPSSYFSKQLLLLCEQHRVLYISDIDEWFASNEFPGGRFAPFYWANEYNMRITQKLVQNKIVISSFLDTYYISSNNIILPPLVDSNEDKWEDKSVILPPFNGIRVIYAGTPARKDLLDTMLTAVIFNLKRDLNIQFIIVGIKSEDVSSYKNYNEIKQWPNNIIFFGKVPQKDVPIYYKSSDFSILIRKDNRKNRAGFPTKFVESMMSGCPAIVNITSDLSKYIQDGENGIILSDFSMNSLAETLAKAIRLSTDDINKMKKQAIASSKEYFHYGNYIDNMKEFLKNTSTNEYTVTTKY